MAAETFGIVGYGHFGEFLAVVQKHGKVLVTDIDAEKLPKNNGIRAAVDGGYGRRRRGDRCRCPQMLSKWP